MIAACATFAAAALAAAGLPESISAPGESQIVTIHAASGVAGGLRLAAAGSATGNRALAPQQVTTKPDGSPTARKGTDNRAPLGNKIDETCTGRHCGPHPHGYGNQH